MKNIKVILLVFLVISVFYNVYSFKSETVGNGTAMMSTTMDDNTPCDNKDRYGKESSAGAIRLTRDAAKTIVLNYRENNPASAGHPTGYIFTKRMFDEIFSDPTVNAVALDLGVKNDTLTLIVSGFNSTATAISGEGTDHYYAVKSFCPTDCSAW